MGPKDVIKQTLDMSDFILHKYLDDLSDADLRLRPVEGMHPIALAARAPDRRRADVQQHDQARLGPCPSRWIQGSA